MTVPETTLTGAVAMMQNPIVNSRGKMWEARAQESSGIKTKD